MSTKDGLFCLCDGPAWKGRTPRNTMNQKEWSLYSLYYILGYIKAAIYLLSII